MRMPYIALFQFASKGQNQKLEQYLLSDSEFSFLFSRSLRLAIVSRSSAML